MIMWPSKSLTSILMLWILCAIAFNSCIWGLKVQCNETDQQKLLNFKQKVRDSSGMLSTWSKKQGCCLWAGVDCDHLTHRVTKLILPCSDFHDDRNCLAGEFSLSNLLELEFLNYLDLSWNYLLFTPHCCGNYSSKLSYLDLSSSHPEAEVEDLTWLMHVYSLEYLNLNGIRLRSSLLLESISLLPSLSKLHLSGCQLHYVKPSIDFVNLTFLQVFDLSANNFQADNLPKWLFNMSHLSILDLSKNFFRGYLLESILNLKMLKSLRLYENHLDGPIPNWLGQHENLQYIDLSDNFFVGPITETLGNLSLLIELSLRSNLLNGSIPECLGKLSKLEILDVIGISLTGVISEKNFSQLSNLQKLYLGSPTLTFHFELDWVPPFQLQTIYLAYVHPKLPTWLYTQKSLRRLSIINSSLSLEDQDKFWNFVAEVEFLKLSNISIDVDLSKVLVNSKVTLLIGNNLSGGLPRISPNVIVFVAANNSFSGILSSLLCQKMAGENKLSYLHITDTPLSGGLTECWINWKSLVHVALINNSLTGRIPESMSSLSNLKSLLLNENNLFGYVPASLQNYKALSFLNLAGNKFSGNIPYWISQSVKVMVLRSNQFSGGIPPQLCQLSSLVVLEIANNRLSGRIPTCLHNITAMAFHNISNTYFGFRIKVAGVKLKVEYSYDLIVKGNHLEYWSHQRHIIRSIDLSCNNLIGKIPLEIFTLAALQSLNLSNNHLTGRIPKEISNLKQLESLDLSINQISGEIPQRMSELSFLGFLNLSFNNFTGQIPPTAQFQRFDALSYIGNPELHGAPLTKNFTQEEKHNLMTHVENVDDEEFLSWFYIGMGVGFAIGFWAVCASLFFNRTWRHAYFRLLDELKSQLHMFMWSSR